MAHGSPSIAGAAADWVHVESTNQYRACGAMSGLSDWIAPDADVHVGRKETETETQ